MAFTRDEKELLYREWVRQGFPSWWSFANWLKEQVKNKNPDFTWLDKAPSDVTLGKWYEDEGWEKKAQDDQKLIRETLTRDAVQLKQEMFRQLKESALAKMNVQDTIFKAARLEDLEPKEARGLLEAAQEIGRSGSRDMEQALLLLGESSTSLVKSDKPVLESLGDFFNEGLGKELKVAMAAQLTSKSEDVVEGKFVEVDKEDDD